MLNLTQKKRMEAKRKCWQIWKLYKLMNNAIYGKIMENSRNRTDAKLVSNNLKWTSKPNYTSFKIFDNDVDAISKSKVKLTLNKLVYFRMRILDLSKVMMYEFHHDYIKNEYGNNSKKQQLILSKNLLDLKQGCITFS